MKLRLHPAWRRSLLTAIVTIGTQGAFAGLMHPDVSFQTYTDFGQNKGRYVVEDKENALLDFIRQKEGITIPYTDGQAGRQVASYQQGMINFSASCDGGNVALIAPNFVATVKHNPDLDTTYGGRELGMDYAIRSEAIHVEGSTNFRLFPDSDYALQRQSKIITNATWNPLYTIPNDKTEKEAIEALAGKTGTEGMLYHAGGGFMCLMGAEKNPNVAYGESNAICDAHTYIIGSVNDISESGIREGSSDNVNMITTNPGGSGSLAGGATDANPLPWAARRDDSGSPTYVYNAETGRYEYIAAVQSLMRRGTQSGLPDDAATNSLGAITWSKSTMNSFNVEVKMDGKKVSLSAPEKTNTTITEDVTVDGHTTTHSTTIYSGKISDESGNDIAYNGIEAGKHTWADLSAEKDKDNWYAYSTYEVPVEGKDGVMMEVSYLNPSSADLFNSSNLVFSSDAGKYNNVVLNDTVDLGVGYAEFSGGRFYIYSEGSESNRFNHAGYVINKGAGVYLNLVNPANHMTEWRKIGEGDLFIEGTGGDTNALLNVGGTGSTYLDQKDKDGKTAYAAYNVLANTGATVQITGGVDQIKRDFTFGAGGGKLDMYGHSMVWDNDKKTDDSGFSIHALTEEAVITNTTGETTLTVTNAATSVDNSHTYVGSFQDSANGALKIVYNDSDATWTLHSIHTDLSKNKDSGFEVASGKVVLSGSNTVHGMGSFDGMSAERAKNDNDWHYADASMNVKVANGATFELGSHARLTGDISVEDGGTFVMRQSVNTQWEHVEGGAFAEDTYQYREFYGLKGNVNLASDKSSMLVQLGQGSEKVDSITEYKHVISGKGNLTVSASAQDAALRLAGANTFTGGTTLLSGTLITAHDSALGKGSVSLGANKLVMENNLTLDGVLTADGATLDMGGKTLKLNTANNSLKDITLRNGTLTVGDSANVTLSGKLSITSADKKDGITIADHQGGEAQLSKVKEISHSGTTVTVAGTAEEHAVISHSFIDVLEGSTLSLLHTTVDASTRITDAPATLSVQDVQLSVMVGTNAETQDTITTETATLKQLGDATQTLTLGADARVLTITSSQIDTVTVLGDSLTINLSGVDNLSQFAFVSLTFTDGEHAALFSTDMKEVCLQVDEKKIFAPAYYLEKDVIKYNNETGTYTGTLYFAVPEPTTATLSLLGLTGLMLRRKRR